MTVFLILLPVTVLFDNVVRVTKQDEGEILKDGTYMVNQKMEHDLDRWRQLSLAQQEDWVGRKKITGLLKGTLSDEEDKILGQNLQSPNQRMHEQAEKRLKEPIKQQRPLHDDFMMKIDSKKLFRHPMTVSSTIAICSINTFVMSSIITISTDCSGRCSHSCSTSRLNIFLLRYGILPLIIQFNDL
jgi:hypothetical protein